MTPITGLSKPTKNFSPLEGTASLYEALLELKTADECRRFFTDLCTPGELSALQDRWSVANLLDQAIPYRSIQKLTGISTATITRVARSLMLGESGYRLILNRLKEKNPKKRGHA